MRKATNEFLLKHGMHYETIDMNNETQAFLSQMRNGLAGLPSSLMMIPTFITLADDIPCDREVLVMDAGGTNFRVAVITYGKDRSMTISHFSKHPMPGTQGRIGIDAFFEKIVDYMEPVLKHTNAETVGFCFSFATTILPNKEGSLSAFSKEILVDGVDGQLIGESVNKVLAKRGYAPKRFVLLNDTVATMLGGVSVAADKQYSSFIGYILGTGTNTCYLEHCEQIVKSPDARKVKGRMAINCESGMYDGISQGDYDKEVDRESAVPGGSRFEKMISGAYQGKVIYKTVRGAVEDGLFSQEFAQRFARAQDSFTMPQIDGFCAQPKGDGDLACLAADNEHDRDTLYDIIDASFERAARLTAIVFASIMQQTQSGSSPQSPVCITAEGTSFTKSVLFGKKLDRYIKEYLNGELRVYCDIISVENATLIGSAMAALMD